MHVVSGALTWTNRFFTAVALIAALATLYLWTEALLWWGDPGAMASALTWTVVTVVLFACVIAIERLETWGA